jgi:hypothetical protein
VGLDSAIRTAAHWLDDLYAVPERVTDVDGHVLLDKARLDQAVRALREADA